MKRKKTLTAQNPSLSTAILTRDLQSTSTLYKVQHDAIRQLLHLDVRDHRRAEVAHVHAARGARELLVFGRQRGGQNQVTLRVKHHEAALPQ